MRLLSAPFLFAFTIFFFAPVPINAAESINWTFYAPGAAGWMQGGLTAAAKDASGATNAIHTLDDVRTGASKYVTLASATVMRGRWYCIGAVTYTSPINNGGDGQVHTLQNVVGYVHDTGCAFNGTCSCSSLPQYCNRIPHPEKMDIPVGNFGGWGALQAANYVTKNKNIATTNWQQIAGLPTGSDASGPCGGVAQETGVPTPAQYRPATILDAYPQTAQPPLTSSIQPSTPLPTQISANGQTTYPTQTYQSPASTVSLQTLSSSAGTGNTGAGATTSSQAIIEALVATGIDPTTAASIASARQQVAVDYLRAVSLGDTAAMKALAAQMGINGSVWTDIQSVIAAANPAGAEPGTPGTFAQTTITGASTFGAVSSSGNAGSALSASGKTVTFYVPAPMRGCSTTGELCDVSTRPNVFGDNSIMTLDCVRAGGCAYVSVASDPSNYGKYYDVGTVTYTSSADGQKHTVTDVVGYVHDTNADVKGRPDKIEIAATSCDTCTKEQKQQYKKGSVTPTNGVETEVVPETAHPTSPLAILSGKQSPLVGNTYGSPFAMVNPLFASKRDTVSPVRTETYSTVTEAQPINPLPVYQPAEASVSLIVQPNIIAAGDAVSVAWSSAGIPAGSPCTLFLNGTPVSGGISGSQHYSLTSSGVFSLACTDSRGSAHVKTENVTVQ
ncbi:hypothetical protein K8R03_00840 [Candidatus Kaiserbacteria bacterium]|nr:hypothetical protein [Candidatus Kaiserbacteria bacterium]